MMRHLVADGCVASRTIIYRLWGTIKMLPMRLNDQ